MSTIIRYPGGKGKFQDIILHRLHAMATRPHEYREPFYGGGAVGIDYLSEPPATCKNAWINDKDVGIACLHTSVIRYPELLCSQILNYLENWDTLPEEEKQKVRLQKASEFRKLQEESKSWTSMPTSQEEILEYGMKKLVIHQMSYSGLGVKSGGPLGGLKQESAYPIDCRWSPNYLVKKIHKLHQLYSRFSIREQSCTNYDWSLLIRDEEFPTILYLDPPYYHKGKDLYQHAFDEADHRNLCESLKFCPHSFLLSYDDCDEIRDLYSSQEFSMKRISMKCTITATKQVDEEGVKRVPKTKYELLIVPSRHDDVLSDL